MVGGVLGAVAGKLWSKRMGDRRIAMEQATRGTNLEVSRIADNQLKLNIPNDIPFAIGSAAIKPQLRAMLDPFASSLRDDPTARVAIIGHTDNTGWETISNPLSVERAQSVRNYLSDRAVTASRIETAGHNRGAISITMDGLNEGLWCGRQTSRIASRSRPIPYPGNLNPTPYLRMPNHAILIDDGKPNLPGEDKMKTIVALTLAAACSTLAAQTCTPREFSAYKEQAKKSRPIQRELLAMDYCQHAINAGRWAPGTRGRETCDAEMQKINDALSSVHANREMNWAFKGCPGDFADFK